MKTLLNKELKLTLHPTNLIFLGLSMMVLIPNYPYMVLFFYTTLGVFFLCLTGRENHDIFYTVTLPIRKSDAVLSRMVFVCIIEFAQAAITVPFAIIRNTWPEAMKNQVGFEANIAFFGVSFIMLGIFNFFFFVSYYKNPDAVGKAFMKGSIAEFIWMILAECSVHAVPYLRDVIDTYDPQNLIPKLVILIGGIAVFLLLTFMAYKKGAASFEKLDLRSE